MTGRKKITYVPPVRQWTGPHGWALAKGTPAGHSYRVLYQGQNVGLVHPERDAEGVVWWRYTAKKRLLARTSSTSRRYVDWRTAAAAITRSPMAHIIVGHREHHVRAEEWRQDILLRGTPWEPKPLPLSQLEQFKVIMYPDVAHNGVVSADVVDVYSNGDGPGVQMTASREDFSTPASIPSRDAALEKLGYYRTEPWKPWDDGSGRASTMVASVRQ